MNKQEIDRLARIIWDYHRMNQKLEKADCILVLGSHDLRVAEYGAKLFLEAWAPQLIFSGGVTGRITKAIWNESEADKFAATAIHMGVPKEKIIIENTSSNTGENILFTKKLLEEKGINFKKFIVVHKPYMERRTYATFKKIWPRKQVIVTSPPISFEKCHYGLLSHEDVIALIVGDLQRIKLYAGKGLLIPQEIPTDVWNAYEKLVGLGYTKYLVI